MSAILKFYQGTGRDGSGRALDEILGWTDGPLEAVHDYVQWLFPLPEPSGANPWAPVLSAGDTAAFRESAELRARLRAAFARMLSFYGLAEDAGQIVPGPHFASRARNWLTPGNHNHLRITRMLRSLRLLGLEEEAQALWRCLDALYRDEGHKHRSRITERTYGYWRRAATEPLESG